MTNNSPTKSDQSNLNRRYEPLVIEQRWQQKWQTDGLYKTKTLKEGEKGFYALSMFPYPSGNLHMGHVRNYVITDVIARVERMKGKAVLHPMGWDAFGLPAENAAIERGVNPGIWTKENIKQMKKQLNRLGLSIDWDREQTTCESQYYKWTQYLFLELYESGLAYQNAAEVNWDPIDKTVLANEQVDSEGKSWRSGALVEKRNLNQWFLKITEYAEDLNNDLNELKGWPDKVKTMQSNWIGKSKGVEIEFLLSNKNDDNNKITVFTTRPDTLYGVTYMAVSTEHAIIDLITEKKIKEEIDILREQSNKVQENKFNSHKKPKKGINTGIKVINPINGDLIPVWVADYVLNSYGTGALMAVPGHDQRDFDFAKSYDLPIKSVIIKHETNLVENLTEAYLEEGILINSGKFNGLTNDKAKIDITNEGIKNGWARNKSIYRLRDWLISRQRYWGCPIPIINCPKCGKVPIPKKDLPVLLPKDVNLQGKGNSSLSEMKNWVTTNCPNCGEISKRETDTMDTFMCSSWYFLRYADPKNNFLPFTINEIDKWLPVNQYVGGIEHAILHLLYSRFITKVLKDKGLVNIKEPFQKLLTQGMVQGITYKNSINDKYIKSEEIKNLDDPKDPNTGEDIKVIYEKMSKSKYNGVDPSKVIDKYGADTARMFILFKAPPEKDLEWNDADVEGQYRFLQRLWKLVIQVKANKGIELTSTQFEIDIENISKEDIKLRQYSHKAIKAITEDLEDGYQLNTAISELMKLSNKINEQYAFCNDVVVKESIYILIRLVAPFAPHISEELWSLCKGINSIHENKWPKVDKEAIKESTYNLVIQLNGKLRTTIVVDKSLDKVELEEIAINNEITKKWLGDSIPKKVIVVAGRLVNIVY